MNKNMIFFLWNGKKVSATDPDSGDLGSVVYSRILPEDPSDAVSARGLHLDAESGEISLVNGGLLDREKRQSKLLLTFSLSSIFSMKSIEGLNFFSVQ